MRRVYYTFAIRLATQPGVVQGFVMLAALIALTYFVSIGNVLQNMAEIQVGQLDHYIMNAFLNTEAWTLLCIGIFVMSALSLRFNFSGMRRRMPKTLRV